MSDLREKLRRAREVREAANRGKEPPFGGFRNHWPADPRCPSCGQPKLSSSPTEEKE